MALESPYPTSLIIYYLNAPSLSPFDIETSFIDLIHGRIKEGLDRWKIGKELDDIVKTMPTALAMPLAAAKAKTLFHPAAFFADASSHAVNRAKVISFLKRHTRAIGKGREVLLEYIYLLERLTLPWTGEARLRAATEIVQGGLRSIREAVEGNSALIALVQDVQYQTGYVSLSQLITYLRALAPASSNATSSNSLKEGEKALTAWGGRGLSIGMSRHGMGKMIEELKTHLPSALHILLPSLLASLNLPPTPIYPQAYGIASQPSIAKAYMKAVIEVGLMKEVLLEWIAIDKRNAQGLWGPTEREGLGSQLRNLESELDDPSLTLAFHSVMSEARLFIPPIPSDSSMAPSYSTAALLGHGARPAGKPHYLLTSSFRQSFEKEKKIKDLRIFVGHDMAQASVESVTTSSSAHLQMTSEDSHGDLSPRSDHSTSDYPHLPFTTLGVGSSDGNSSSDHPCSPISPMSPNLQTYPFPTINRSDEKLSLKSCLKVGGSRFGRSMEEIQSSIILEEFGTGNEAEMVAQAINLEGQPGSTALSTFELGSEWPHKGPNIPLSTSASSPSTSTLSSLSVTFSQTDQKPQVVTKKRARNPFSVGGVEVWDMLQTEGTATYAPSTPYIALEADSRYPVIENSSRLSLNLPRATISGDNLLEMRDWEGLGMGSTRRLGHRKSRSLIELSSSLAGDSLPSFLSSASFPSPAVASAAAATPTAVAASPPPPTSSPATKGNIEIEKPVTRKRFSFFSKRQHTMEDTPRRSRILSVPALFKYQQPSPKLEPLALSSVLVLPSVDQPRAQTDPLLSALQSPFDSLTMAKHRISSQSPSDESLLELVRSSTGQRKLTIVNPSASTHSLSRPPSPSPPAALSLPLDHVYLPEVAPSEEPMSAIGNSMVEILSPDDYYSILSKESVSSAEVEPSAPVTNNSGLGVLVPDGTEKDKRSVLNEVDEVHEPPSVMDGFVDVTSPAYIEDPPAKIWSLRAVFDALPWGVVHSSGLVLDVLMSYIDAERERALSDPKRNGWSEQERVKVGWVLSELEESLLPTNPHLAVTFKRISTLTDCPPQRSARPHRSKAHKRDDSVESSKTDLSFATTATTSTGNASSAVSLEEDSDRLARNRTASGETLRGNANESDTQTPLANLDEASPLE